MNWYNLPPLLAAVVTAMLGWLGYRHAADPTIRRTFAILCASLATWNAGVFLLFLDLAPPIALWCARLLQIGVVLSPVAFLHIVLLVFGLERPRLTWTGYALAGAFSTLNLAGLQVLRVERIEYGSGVVHFYGQGGLVHLLSVIHVAVFCSVALGFLATRARSATGRPRAQGQYLLIGLAFALAGGMNDLLGNLGMIHYPGTTVPIYPVGSLTIIVWASSVSYAIVRHRFMDVHAFMQRILATALAAAALAAPIVLLSAFLPATGQTLVVLVTAGVVAGAAIPRVSRSLEHRVGGSLFRQRYRYREVLQALGPALLRLIDQQELLERLGESLVHTFGLRSGAAYVPDGSGYRPAWSYRTRTGPARIDRPGPVLEDALGRQDLSLYDEARERAQRSGPTRGNRKPQPDPRPPWEVCIPLHGKEGLLAFVLLEAKTNGHPFSREELDLLSDVQAQAAIALENARLHESLARSRELIARTSRLSAVGTLAAGIAHEIRNPLVAVNTFLQLLPERLDDEEFCTDFLGLARSEVERISRLIEQLLTFARSSTRTLEPTNLSDVAADVIALLLPQARKSAVTLQPAFHGDAGRTVIDREQIKQVLLNILLNALQASPPRGTVTVRIYNADRASRPFSVVEVTDEGPGIPQDQIEHIFAPFSTTKENGTGLGLAVAQRIVTEHGGFIDVVSRPGEGATFAVWLPREGSYEPARVASRENAPA